MLEALRPAMVLLDLRLSEEDGRSVLRHLRAQPELSETPVYIISGASEVAALSTGTGLDRIDGFFEKPLQLPKLLDTVASVVRPVRSVEMSDFLHDRLRQAFAAGSPSALDQPLEAVVDQVKPADPAHGDLAFPTFPLAKQLRKAPPAIAAELAGKLRIPGLEVSRRRALRQRALRAPHLRRPPRWPRCGRPAWATATPSAGRGQDGGHRLLLAQHRQADRLPPHPHHADRPRLANLYRSQGWRVEGDQLPRRLGQAVRPGGGGPRRLRRSGAARRHGPPGGGLRPGQRPGRDRSGVRRARPGPSSAAWRRATPEALALWSELRETSLRGFLPIYERLGIHFEHIDGESRYQGRMEAVIEEIARTVGVRESEGALVVDLPYAEGEPPVLLRKNDGSTLYATRDLAAAEDRWERFHFDRSLYVVARDQALHFGQVFRVLEAMGKPWAEPLHPRDLRPDQRHVHPRRQAGAAQRRARRGRGPGAGEGAAERRRRAHPHRRPRAAGRAGGPGRGGLRRPQEPPEHRLHLRLGGGARVRRPHRSLPPVRPRPRLQSPQAGRRRARPLRDSSAAHPPRGAAAGAATLALFPGQVRAAVEQDEPSFVARHLLEVAAEFSRWYTLGNQDRDKRVVHENDAGLRAARLALADAVRIVLATGLALLGMAAPESM